MRGITGNFDSNPRVFAHSAIVVKPRSVLSLKPVAAGESYTVGTTYVSAGGNAATDQKCSIKVTIIDSVGGIIGWEVINGGTGYTIGDVITLSAQGGATAQFEVESMDLPDTWDRGATIYCGAAQTEIEVVMENGKTIEFVGVLGGTFLPILVKRVINYTTYTGPTNGGTQPNPGELLALY